MNLIKREHLRLKTKRTFLKQGTCSRTFFHILNREFGNPKPMHEQAVDPLAGGIAQMGYQCGMLWGAALGVGNESFRRFKNASTAIGMAIRTTQKIHESFVEHAKTPNCEEITSTDWKKKFGILKYMITGKMITCFSLAGRWAPHALKVADEGLRQEQKELPTNAISCDSETIRRMGGSEEEAVMVAGFAGGLGLSGNACGALGAAIWKSTLEQVKSNNYKYSLTDPKIEKLISAFYKSTDYCLECSEICGKKFNSIDEHSDYIRNGGCEKVISTLVDKKL